MAKRKAGVNDIIYELDNEDIELSSEDDEESKKRRFVVENNKKTYENKKISGRKCIDIICLDSPDQNYSKIETRNQTNNGGKIVLETTSIKASFLEKDDLNKIQVEGSTGVNSKKGSNERLTTEIFEEELIDSPASNSDYGVVGCENRTPLVTVRFKDTKLAHVYKKSIKEYLINLLKLESKQKKHTINDYAESDNELEIWPEDLADDDAFEDQKEVANDGLFFVDTEPCDNEHTEVPQYSQNSSVITNTIEVEPSQETFRRRPTCFNCDGDHQLRDCTLPRNNQRIAEKRKTIPVKMGRYHVEDDQKYGHLVPGRISTTLRNALGLKRYELPLHIYRMRLLGYPPGWLEEARISHSGITLFDSTGNATVDPEEEEGELCEPGSKDKFDIKKILDFPGFNVPASSRYIEEGDLLGIPPMSEQDSKMSMLQTLAPNAVKAYKRKKLLLFPSSNNNSLQGQAEMELDSGDETAAFPSVPPLPDDEPPPALPPPPPPSSPPPLPTLKPSEEKESTQSNIQDQTVTVNKTIQSPKKKQLKEIKSSSNTELPNVNIDKKKSTNGEDMDNSSDIEVIEVLQVNDIPVPDDDLITIDEDYDSTSQLDSDLGSPSLDDLEKKKRLLINALKSDTVPDSDTTIDLSESIETLEVLSDTGDITIIDDLLESAEKEQSNKKNDVIVISDKDACDKHNSQIKESDNTNINNVEVEITSIQKVDISNNDEVSPEIISTDASTSNELSEVDVTLKPNGTETPEFKNNVISKPPPHPTTSNVQTNYIEATVQMPDTKAGQVRTTLYGTPVINVASSYVKLPSDEKFAKDICDVINFENLPNSTGKYKKISTLLKKVKTVVDRIQES